MQYKLNGKWHSGNLINARAAHHHLLEDQATSKALAANTECPTSPGNTSSLDQNAAMQDNGSDEDGALAAVTKSLSSTHIDPARPPQGLPKGYL
ncbi:hypothetical protein PCASD_11221 [Puccinia coronata f. sp. avenae]|uniref:Uncharacterized protein n=1 Tax=Puccinia coronata f. sp. avenae TaxID=200324 RepID=A0A2N5UBP8_9BASI|nr:hypothetical protein PCASD_23915 [Puccinia coronata f. sp. avenae]PLW35165.1 hypothetical protein PCASD_11221 [Puccinia coronata f. sp. avenae]